VGVGSIAGVDKKHAEFWLEILNRRGQLRDPGINGRIILKCILGK